MRVIHAARFLASLVLVALAVVLWLTIVPIADALRGRDAREEPAPNTHAGPRASDP